MNQIQFMSSCFNVRSCYISGPIPSSIGELTKLKQIRLSYNYFSGQIPSSLLNLTQLTYLSLSYNNFSPGSLSWLVKQQTKLIVLGLSQTNLYGEIPSSVGNLTQLTGLDLGLNKLQGQIPQSIFNLTNLGQLFLDSNDLNGTLKFDSFQNLKNLVQLQLSHNHLSVLTNNVTINATLPKFTNLALAYCNLLEFPDFLREQDELEILQISGNKIHGQIPEWVWQMSKESLNSLGLSENFLTGFDQPIFPMTNLRVLDLESNKLQGSIPIPPPSIMYYSVSNNSLTGEFSPLLCNNLSSLALLDLSNNNLSGMLPQCLANMSESLAVLDLHNNNFVGSIPRLCIKGCHLKMIDFSQNQFQRQLPRSLANCDMVESLNTGNNQLNDTFPFWLGKLPELRILILRRNQFHGTIQKQSGNFEFPKLQIIDLSFNRFIGNLPSHQFQNWIAMQLVDAAYLSYLQADSVLGTLNDWGYNFPYSLTLKSKGKETDYEKIQDFLVAIDFSSNSFQGCIPENIGNLKALRLLNLANNALSCHIPPSLGNLSNLESLDLSHNNLSGEIPTELLQLTFLEFFTVSHNNLRGQIPQGKQFATFENNSFGSNPGLCGKPLSKACKSSQAPPSLSLVEDKEGQEPLLQFDWKIILIGYGGGLLNGLAIGYMYTPLWFKKYLGRVQQKQRESRKKKKKKPRN